MSLPVPLSVRLRTLANDRNVTDQVRDLWFRKTAPGGYAAATIALDRPLDTQPTDIAYYGSLYIYDGRDGTTEFEGRIEDPGRSAGGDGQVWELTAVGPAAHARDRTVPLIYVDRSLEGWARVAGIDTQGATERDERDLDTPSLKMYYKTEGATIFVNWFAEMRYQAIRNAGMELGRVRCLTDAGFTSTNFFWKLITRQDEGAGTVVHSVTWDTAGGNLNGSVNGSNDIPDGHNVVGLRVTRETATATNQSTLWGEFYDIVVRSKLKDAAGADITTGYTLNTVLASEVVNDLLGRLLTGYDGPNASVATTSFNIEQLAYPDGATAEQVLSDLMEIEAAYYWAAWESNPAGKNRFEWRAWPTTVRYEADVTDGYQSTGSAGELYNAVRVRYIDWRGRSRTVQRTQTVPELTAAGLTREARVDLSDEVGVSQAMAIQAGDQFLAEHATPPNAGTLTIARKIFDRDKGRMVMPWEIDPGHLIRVRGVLPRVDSLNPTARDGVTVFKIAATEYGAGSASASLELDSYPPTVARALAQLARRRITRQR